ncbi:MAG: hypothetical protein R2939_02635 [Kofleriaceae bacterium]
MLCRSVVVAALLLTVSVVAGACVSEEQTTVAAAALGGEVVVAPALPRVGCGLCTDDHVVGEPVWVAGSYEGRCEDPWTGEYVCQEQDFELEIECVGAPCLVGAPGDAPHQVRPLSEDPLQLVVHMHVATGDTFSFAVPPFSSKIPDGIDVECRSDLPASGGPGRECGLKLGPPVQLRARLMKGDLPLARGSDFEIASSRPGWLSSYPEAWVVDGYGPLLVRFTYGELASEVSLDVRESLLARRPESLSLD